MYDSFCGENIDAVWNYMQYTPERYKKRFSPEQINNMVWALTSDMSPRKGLLRQ